MDTGDASTEVAARRARRRRWIAGGAALAVATVVLGFGALWASDLLRLDSGPRPALADRALPRTTRAPGAGSPPECRSPLTPEAPLRLWIGGDSLAGSLGPSLGAQVAATGVVQPVYDSRVSSGLSSPEFFDWPDHASEEMTRLNPEIVVFVMGANDWKAPDTSSPGDAGEPAWRADYARRVTEMLAVLQGDTSSGSRRRVYWVGSPPLQERRKDAGVRDINAVARAVVEAHPDAHYVDAYELFADDGSSDGEGAYTATLPGPDGDPVRVRAGDGVHLTQEGGILLAVHVYGPIEGRCDLEAQAVIGQPKPVLRTRGSTDVDGTTATPTGPGASGGSDGAATTVPPPAEDPEPAAPTPDPTPEPTPPSQPEEPADPPVEPPPEPDAPSEPAVPSG